MRASLALARVVSNEVNSYSTQNWDGVPQNRQMLSTEADELIRVCLTNHEARERLQTFSTLDHGNAHRIPGSVR